MERPDKTLIILTPGFPADETDSTCLPLQQSLIKTLKKLYPQLNIIVLSFQYPYTNKEYQWFDIPVINFNGRNRGGFARLLRQRNVMQVLKQINKRQHIIGLLSFWHGECAYVGKRFADKHRLKHFAWLFGQDARENNPFVKRSAPRANELIALSDFIQAEFLRNYQTKPTHVIPLGIDPTLFYGAAHERDIDILAVGSLIPLKQYDLLPAMIAFIKEQLPRIKVMLAGKGPEKEKIGNLISKYKLDSTITLTGELPYTAVLRLMQRTKVFFHLSPYEAFPGVCLEAIGAGARAISFCQPMKEPLEHWDTVADTEAMKKRAIELLQQPASFFTPSVPFSMNDTAEELMKLF